MINQGHLAIPGLVSVEDQAVYRSISEDREYDAVISFLMKARGSSGYAGWRVVPS